MTFFGSTEWRKLVESRQEGERITYRRLLDFYEQRLRDIGYTEVDNDINIANSNEANIYHLVFAAKHERATDFWKKISRRKYSGQARMFR